MPYTLSITGLSAGDVSHLLYRLDELPSEMHRDLAIRREEEPVGQELTDIPTNNAPKVRAYEREEWVKPRRKLVLPMIGKVQHTNLVSTTTVGIRTGIPVDVLQTLVRKGTAQAIVAPGGGRSGKRYLFTKEQADIVLLAMRLRQTHTGLGYEQVIEKATDQWLLNHPEYSLSSQDTSTLLMRA